MSTNLTNLANRANSLNKGEVPKSCVTPSSDARVKTVHSGEICTIETAKTYGIFDSTKYFKDIPLIEANKINIHIDNNDDTEKEYALCNVQNKTAYKNCVLSTNNPWKTLNDTGEFCMLPLDVSLPNALRYNENTKLIDKPNNIPLFRAKKDYCQEKWYDWFTIPDYFLNNTYNLYKSSSNIEKCLRPCNLGFIASDDKCVPKIKYDYGKFSTSFHYLPVSLILLLGSTRSSLLAKHNKILYETKQKLSNDVYIDNDLYDNLTGNESQTNIYNDIKKELKEHIINLLNIPFNEDNIIEPSYDVQSVSNKLMFKDRIEDAYEIAKTIYTMSTSTKDDDIKLFKEWKEQLADITGLSQTDTKFFKQILILKKACNVAFDNQTTYSSDFILYTLNKDLKTGEKIKAPINFAISEEDSTLAISQNTSENVIDLTPEQREKQSQMMIEQKRVMDKLDTDGLHINKMADNDPLKYDYEKIYNEDQNVTNAGISISKTFIMIIVFIVLLILFGGVLYIILSLLWNPFTELLNTVVLGFCYIILYGKSMFKGKHSSSEFRKELIQLQSEFLDKKIINDMKKFKLFSDKQ
jgi:hypothetical protein